MATACVTEYAAVARIGLSTYARDEGDGCISGSVGVAVGKANRCREYLE
jgi:hypothetical protein